MLHTRTVSDGSGTRIGRTFNVDVWHQNVRLASPATWRRHPPIHKRSAVQSAPVLRLTRSLLGLGLNKAQTLCKMLTTSLPVAEFAWERAAGSFSP